jgi:sterol desaturase/sphingolipid hydroxylase (fatty acid hydroxylase superfamily)
VTTPRTWPRTLYQFWIHTRTIGQLGPLEWVLNTPSRHRVHHGRNPKYVAHLHYWVELFDLARHTSRSADKA